MKRPISSTPEDSPVSFALWVAVALTLVTPVAAGYSAPSGPPPGGFAARSDPSLPKMGAFVPAADSEVESGILDYGWCLNATAPPDPLVASETSADSGEGAIGRLRRWITGLGPAGILVYVVAYVLLTVLFVPAWPLTVGAGAAYGVVLGTAIVSVSSVTGAALAFLVARYLLRSRVERWVEGNVSFAAIDRAVGREGWKIVGLTRLSPVFPFNLQNYAYGLTAVGFWAYVFASWIAMLPGTLLYVYLGAASVDVAEAATGAANWGKTALQVVGLLATLAVTVLITRIARKALKEAAGEVG